MSAPAMKSFILRWIAGMSYPRELPPHPSQAHSNCIARPPRARHCQGSCVGNRLGVRQLRQLLDRRRHDAWLRLERCLGERL